MRQSTSITGLVRRLVGWSGNASIRRSTRHTLLAYLALLCLSVFTGSFCITVPAKMHSFSFLSLPLPTRTQLRQPCIRPSLMYLVLRIFLDRKIYQLADRTTWCNLILLFWTFYWEISKPWISLLIDDKFICHQSLSKNFIITGPLSSLSPLRACF